MGTTKVTGRIAILGNPNSGKSSLFNALTGLNQKIGNYPGVTVDKKTGFLVRGDQRLELIDFPGTYSLYPNSSDEKIVVESITQVSAAQYPEALVYVASAMELEKHFLLATQLKELGLPMLFCISMLDISEKKGIRYDVSKLSAYLECEVMLVSSLTGENIELLEDKLLKLIDEGRPPKWKYGYQFTDEESLMSARTGELTDIKSDYINLLLAHHVAWIGHLDEDMKKRILQLREKVHFNSTKMQIRETLYRFDDFVPVIQGAVTYSGKRKQSLTERLDEIVTHRLWGPVIFFLIMMLVFQAIFSWSEWPMSLIESSFAFAEGFVHRNLPPGWFNDLLSNGVIAGLGGIMVFIPQIAILFLLISILEEVGYMARAVFMFDRIMQRFGLNGRSIVALISGGACAIPAIMSTRTISNWKERLITILVTPLISCSARIPVYTILIAFAVPKTYIGGIFNSQAIAFMGLYVLGIMAALLSAWVFKQIIKNRELSYLMIELPHYRKPIAKNVLVNVNQKVWTFITEAGKVILIISIILWFLASYGPAADMKRAEEVALLQASENGYTEPETDDLIASLKLEASYAGNMGKWIEPVIKPLGFDWKIGIALITSFAAREVFVGTMATIYSVGSTEDELTLRQKMATEINPDTGGIRYDMATAVSLLLFYVFALQCMSTLAITKRETKSWKWPLVQFVFMGALAYLSSFGAYQLLS